MSNKLQRETILFSLQVFEVFPIHAAVLEYYSNKYYIFRYIIASPKIT